MKSKIALSLIVAALMDGCTSAPTWDTSVFPNQGSYDASPAAEVAAEVPK